MKTSTGYEECEHSQYCALSKTVCVETNFPDYCRMKKSELSSMPLLEFIKNSILKKSNS